MSKKSRCNVAQIDCLIELLSDPGQMDVALNEYSGPQGAQKILQKWENMQEILNNLGPPKTIKQWQHTWRDMKKRARDASSAQRRAAQKTGNTAVVPQLDIKSTKILNIIGYDCAVGMEGIQESPIGAPVTPQHIEPAASTPHSPYRSPSLWMTEQPVQPWLVRQDLTTPTTDNYDRYGTNDLSPSTFLPRNPTAPFTVTSQTSGQIDSPKPRLVTVDISNSSTLTSPTQDTPRPRLVKGSPTALFTVTSQTSGHIDSPKPRLVTGDITASSSLTSQAHDTPRPRLVKGNPTTPFTVTSQTSGHIDSPKPRLVTGDITASSSLTSQTHDTPRLRLVKGNPTTPFTVTSQTSGHIDSPKPRLVTGDITASSSLTSQTHDTPRRQLDMTNETNQARSAALVRNKMPKIYSTRNKIQKPATKRSLIPNDFLEEQRKTSQALQDLTNVLRTHLGNQNKLIRQQNLWLRQLIRTSAAERRETLQLSIDPPSLTSSGPCENPSLEREIEEEEGIEDLQE